MKLLIQLFLLFLLFQCIKGTTTTTTKKFPVAFRIDDIQDYWITVAQESVISYFMTNSLPITIGIISNYFGTDPDIVGFVQSAVTSPYVEVWDHGYNHEDFTTFNLSAQINLQTMARGNISSYLGTTYNQILKGFVPPFNSWNSDTETALATAGYTMISSEVDQDPPPWNYNNPAVWHVPIGAATGDETDSGGYNPRNASTILTEIQSQINSYGYSAVMMHPMEFSIPNGTDYANELNTYMYQQMDLVVKALLATPNIEFTTLSGIIPYLKNGTTTNNHITLTLPPTNIPPTTYDPPTTNDPMNDPTSADPPSTDSAVPNPLNGQTENTHSAIQPAGYSADGEQLMFNSMLLLVLLSLFYF